MARIPEAEIEASGIELKKGGKEMLGRCPFHEDATASLVVPPGKNLWHRHGRCCCAACDSAAAREDR